MEALIKQRIEEAALDAVPPGTRHTLIRRKEFIKGATFALQNQWISVEEGLPEEEKKVLVTHQYGCQVAAFYKDDAYSYWGVAKDCPIGASITRRMAIPELKGEMKSQKDEPFLSQEERDAFYAMMYHARAQQGSAIPPTPAMYRAASNVKLEWLPQQLELTF